jgi:hypothetical protein
MAGVQVEQIGFRIADISGMILALLPLLFLMLIISFGCGYGVREWISRRRRAAEREKYYKAHPEERLIDLKLPPRSSTDQGGGNRRGAILAGIRVVNRP